MSARAERTIEVGRPPYEGETNEVLQRAVDDAAAEGGGTVRLRAGTYLMHDALHLRSGVALVGQGEETVLRMAPAVSSRVADNLGYGHFEATVDEPELFRPGMGVMIRSDSTHGFDVTVATIREIDGKHLFIDRRLNYDYPREKGGRVVSVHPLVSVRGERNVRVANLKLDGGGEAEILGGCRGGAVYLLQSHGVTVEDLTIRNFNGDGVSFQQCTDVVVRGCDVSGMTENGLHPGSGSVRYMIADNHVHGCGGMGIFYCLRTTHSLCENNRLVANGRGGISIGERDTDHIVRQNEIRGNAWAGIQFREVGCNGGDRVVLEANRLSGNCAEQDDAEILVPERIRQVVLQGNEFCELRGAPLSVGQAADVYVAEGNTVEGEALGAGQVVDPDGVVEWRPPDARLEVGPAYAAEQRAARHLGVELPAQPPNFSLDAGVR